MKGKMSIAKKLFIITTIVFAVFISGTLIIQSLFFERFYISKKENELKTTVKDFKESYDEEEDAEKVGDLIEEFERSNNVSIVILDKSNRLKFVVSHSKNKADAVRMREITDFAKKWSENKNFSQAFKSNGKITILKNENKKTSSGNLIGVVADDKKDEVIFIHSSLQPVNEAVSVIEQFYKYFCLVAVLFILLLALVYSNMIVKPLKRINKVATKMARLDFSEKCVIINEDEIGNVASSLNFLSENLDYALTSLRNANSKLEEDIEKERNLEKMRREFVASVSHELKTPITLIDGYAVGLKDDIFEGQEEDFYLDIIIDEARKMGSLVSDMLDLSHLESGSFKFTREEFKISELIHFTLKKYKTLIDDKEVNLRLELIEDTMVCADWNRLEQVFTNFITNALRHVDEKGTIKIEMVEEESKIKIQVENTGSNIPEEEISKVWDKFYKIDKSRNRKLGGTGIGLSIVKNILMLHNYSYGVENTDSGVKFYFSIPKEY